MRPKLVSIIGWFWLLFSSIGFLKILFTTANVIMNWSLVSRVYQSPPIHGLENSIKVSAILFENLKLILVGGIIISAYGVITSVSFLRLKLFAKKSMKLLSYISICSVATIWIWFIKFKSAADTDGVGLRYGSWGHMFFFAWLSLYLLTLWGLRTEVVVEAFAKTEQLTRSLDTDRG